MIDSELRKGESVDYIFGDSFEAAAPPPSSVRAAIKVMNKLAYGPRPGDVAAFDALGGNDAARLAAWVEQQLTPGNLDDSACTTRIAAASYTTLNKTLAQLWADHVRGAQSGYPQRLFPAAETQCVKMLRAVYSRRQLFERMVEFWHDHFNVQGWEFNLTPLFLQYDRDVMRVHTFGNFRQLLEEVAKAPAMLMYLDNKSSTAAGFNENFARELCELHTLGADHYFPGNDPEQVPRGADNVPLGYCDNDVYEAARALTGWTLRDAHWQFPALPEYDSGEFLYWDNWHDKAGKYFLGRYILANNPGGALADGRRVMDLLCQHPGTARHLCTKLIRRFITDDPPAALVESAAAIWRTQWQAPDQIAQVLRHILNAPEVLSLWGAKTKRPFEAFAQALRATSAEFSPTAFPAAWMPYNLLDALIQQTGHGPFRWPTPDGFPDVASKWQGVGTLAQTWKLMSWLPELRASGSGDTPFLLRILDETFSAFPTSTDRTATALVDFWLGRIIGFTVEASRRAQLIDFLRQNASAGAPIDLVSDDLDAGVPQRRGRWNGNNLAQHYSIARLRSTVALMFALPEFHQR